MNGKEVNKVMYHGVKRHGKGGIDGKETAKKTVYHIVAVILALILVFPFFYMLMRSLMSVSQIMARPVEVFPKGISLSSYAELFSRSGYVSALLQTMKIVVFNIMAVPLSASFVAYGFARMNFPGKKIVFAVMMATMMIPGAVLQVPQYVMFANFGWLNTVYPLTIPNLCGGGAVYIFLITQFMRGIPKEIEEAGVIDGANPFLRYIVLIVPMCIPVFIYVIINVFNGNWGDFYGPLVYMSASDKPTLAYVVFNDAITADVSEAKEGLRMAAGTFMSILPVVLFVVFQKQLIEGVAVSSLKG